MSQGLRRLAPQIITLLIVVALVTFFFPSFLSVSMTGDRMVGPVIDVLKRSAPVALLAIGMTLVIATKGIDLSVGATIAIAGACAAWAITSGFGVPVALFAALAAGLICGLWNGMLVAVFGIQPIVATLILMVAGRGIAQMITQGRILTFNNEGMAFWGAGSVLGLPVPILVWLGTGLLIGLLVRRSALGLLIESIGVNQRAANIAGVNAKLLLVVCYVAAGLCAGIAGIVVTADIRGADANNAGLWLELDAILAVVVGGNSLLGGRFSIAASVLGALIVQTIDTGILLAGFPSEYNLVIKAVLIVVILVLQSPQIGPRVTGLFPSSARQRALASEARK